MRTTSFARSYDFMAEFEESPAPLGWASASRRAEAHDDDEDVNLDAGGLTATFDTEARHRDGASEDAQIGENILDNLFAAAFPGLGAIFAPLGLLDAVDLYDQTRSAFRRTVRPALPAYAQRRNKKADRAMSRASGTQNPTPRRAPQGPALMMG